MRRKDREITDYQTMLEVLAACSCIRLGLADKNGAYIVPVNFGMAEENGKLTLYFHGAKAGKKSEILATNPQVCLVCVGNVKPLEDKFTTEYESAMVFGKISEVSDKEEKTEKVTKKTETKKTTKKSE